MTVILKNGCLCAECFFGQVYHLTKIVLTVSFYVFDVVDPYMLKCTIFNYCSTKVKLLIYRSGRDKEAHLELKDL